MDLSKTYDCIPHNLLIAKLECYGVDKASLSLLLDTLLAESKRPKQVHDLALAVILIQVYHKAQSLVLFYLLYL